MLKKSFSSIISLVLAVAICVTTCTSAFAATSKQEYISELILCSASSADEAKTKLAEQDYELLSTEAVSNSGMYIGYKSTNDPDEAVTGISAMNMEGKYSFSDYEVLMDKMKENVSATVEGLLPMIAAYRTNYNNGSALAVTVHDVLNKFYEDDSKTNMGDYLLNCDLKDTSALTKVFMQGYSSFILDIQQLLFIAGESSGDQKWIEKMGKSDVDFLLDKYIDSYPTPNKAYQAMAAKYGDTADSIRTTWNTFYENLEKIKSEYFQDDSLKLNSDVVDKKLDAAEKAADTGITDDMTDKEKADTILNEYETMAVTDNLIDVSLIDYLDGIEYDGGTMLDFFMRDESEVDDSELYTLAYFMGSSRSAQVNNVGLQQVMSRAMVDSDNVDQTMLDDIVKSLSGFDQISIYEGVDRSLFEDGIALTSATNQKSMASASSWWDGLFSRAFTNDAEYKWYDLLALYVLPTVASGLIWAGLHIGTTLYDKPARALAAARAAFTQSTYDEAGNVITEVSRETLYNLRNTPKTLGYAAYGKGAVANGVGFKIACAFKAAFFVLTIALSVATLVKVFVNIYTDESKTYTAIPSHIVDTVSTDNGDDYVAYTAVQNTDSKAGDLYNYKGKGGWMVLYTTKDNSVGAPLTTDVKIVKGSTNAPLDYDNVTMFGEEDALNLTSKDYTAVNDSANGTYMYVSRGDVSTTGSAFSGGSLALAVGGGAVAGLVIDALLRGIKKKRAKATN